jgi:hypothetical protein
MPPVKEMAPLEPSAPVLPRLSVPALRIVPPEKVFVPVSESRPAPDYVTLAVPEITPV